MCICISVSTYLLICKSIFLRVVWLNYLMQVAYMLQRSVEQMDCVSMPSVNPRCLFDCLLVCLFPSHFCRAVFSVDFCVQEFNSCVKNSRHCDVTFSSEDFGVCR